MSELQAPTGARLVTPDDREIPLVPRYGGVDEAGLHEWVLYGQSGAAIPAGSQLHLDEMPARTSIRVAMTPTAAGLVFAPQVEE